MKILVINKEDENIKSEYNNALGYDAHGAIETANGYEPAFQVILPGYETATFKKTDWDMFVWQKVE